MTSLHSSVNVNNVRISFLCVTKNESDGITHQNFMQILFPIINFSMMFIIMTGCVLCPHYTLIFFSYLSHLSNHQSF